MYVQHCVQKGEFVLFNVENAIEPQIQFQAFAILQKTPEKGGDAFTLRRDSEMGAMRIAEPFAKPSTAFAASRRGSPTAEASFHRVSRGLRSGSVTQFTRSAFGAQSDQWELVLC